MADDRSWSMTWNEAAGQFFVRYRKVPPPPDAKADPWGTKRVPKSFRRHPSLDAERWVIDWYAQHLQTGGMNVPSSQVSPVRKTIALIGESRWLAYRYEDQGTGINTYVGFKRTLRNWILTNDRFEHYRIDHLDMESDFSAEVCLAWVKSLRGSPRTTLRYAQVARQLFEDSIAMGWIDPSMGNPFSRPLVRRELARLSAEADDGSPIIYLTREQAAALLTVPNRKVHDYRRLRYLVALATGLRDMEVQGLVWSDLHLAEPIPYVWVDRQLVKIGPKPFVHIDDLKKRRLSKDAMLAIPSALVGPPKKKSWRPVPLLAVLVEALHYWRRVGWRQHTGFAPKPDDPVFPSSKSNRHGPAGQFCFSESPELLRADLKRLGQETQFSVERSGERIAFDFHALRHTFSTLLELAGVERARIGDLLGHRAGEVAGKHYIGKLLEARAPLIARLDLPSSVQFQGKRIEAGPPSRFARTMDEGRSAS